MSGVPGLQWPLDPLWAAHALVDRPVLPSYSASTQPTLPIVSFGTLVFLHGPAGHLL